MGESSERVIRGILGDLLEIHPDAIDEPTSVSDIVRLIEEKA